MTPKISIITISYNSAAHIEEAIQSVINQSYENIEYIIIDGGSTDGTLDIIDKYKDKIDYFVSEPDKGISDAFNKGINVASGDIIGIINSDDVLCERALYHVYNAYREDIDVYRGKLLMFNDKKENVEQIPTLTWPKIPLRMKVAHPSTFITRRAYEKTKQENYYKLNCKYAMDFDLLLRLERAGCKSIYVPYILAKFRLGGTSQENDDKRRNELCRILRETGSNKCQIFLFNIYYRLRLFMKCIVKFIFGSFFLKIGSKI